MAILYEKYYLLERQERNQKENLSCLWIIRVVIASHCIDFVRNLNSTFGFREFFPDV